MGDRVAVVHADPKTVGFYELCCTTLHEILHTCGFDHTTSVKCLMNPGPYEPCVSGTLFLCPEILYKLCIFLNAEFDEMAVFVKERYESLKREWGDIFLGGEAENEILEVAEAEQWLIRRIKFAAEGKPG